MAGENEKPKATAGAAAGGGGGKVKKRKYLPHGVGSLSSTFTQGLVSFAYSLSGFPPLCALFCAVVLRWFPLLWGSA